MKRKERPVLLGSLAAGLLASACCIGPLVLGAIGLGSLGVGAWLAPARPWFLALTAVLLGIGFYFAYRPVRAGACEPGQACETPKGRRGQRAFLWSVTLVAIGLATYPSWGARRGDAPAVASPRDSTATVVTLEVTGMTCEACEAEIERGLRAVPGVVHATVDYERSRAEIVASAALDPRELIAAVEETGYDASVGQPAKPDLARGSPSGLAGQWRGPLTVGEDGRTAELIVDLAIVTGRWTGQFDLPDFGVEDYPVAVAVAGPKVTLQFSAAQIGFVGKFQEAGNALAGIAETRGNRDSLVLRRIGDARLSNEFLRLEAVAEDSTRVEPLSASGAELRRRFNQDKAFTRLLMLLSPS
jgi:copper chaperone CopZ